MQISQFLPHQAPMVMIDELIEAKDDYVIAKLTVKPNMMFATAQGLPSWTAIELMAQTISLYSGLKWHAQDYPPQIGFLLGTKKMQFEQAYFALGSEIIIRVEKKSRHQNIWCFDCVLSTGDITIEGLLNVYERVQD